MKSTERRTKKQHAESRTRTTDLAIKSSKLYPLCHTASLKEVPINLRPFGVNDLVGPLDRKVSGSGSALGMLFPERRVFVFLWTSSVYKHLRMVNPIYT